MTKFACLVGLGPARPVFRLDLVMRVRSICTFDQMCNAFGQWHLMKSLPILSKGKKFEYKINFLNLIRVTMSNSL